MDLIERFRQVFAALDAGPLTGPELIPTRLATACATVLPVGGAGISVFTSDGFRIPVGASDTHASDAERLQFTAAEGPCIAAHASGLPIIATESVLSQSWPLFHQGLVTSTPFRAVSSLPLQRGLAEFATIDLFFHRSADVSELDMVALDAVIEQISETLVDGASYQATMVPSWLDSPTAQRRSWTFLALGMINVALHISTQDALAVLRGHAYAADRTIDDLAEDIVNREIPVADLELGGER